MKYIYIQKYDVVLCPMCPLFKLGQANTKDEVKLMLKDALEGVRTSYPATRILAPYLWTTEPSVKYIQYMT